MTIHPLFSGDQIGEAVAWRHHLHRHPEIAFEERDTQAFVAARLAGFGLEVSTGLAGTGVVATLRRGSSQRAIGLRADMDALRLNEATGLPHASTRPGAMHACGHDGHMAMLLLAARRLAADPDLDGTIHFVFQPAEENEGGAARMVADGLFDRHPMEAIYGMHNWPGLAPGTAGLLAGPMMAAFGIFDIILTGRGAHAAMPHQGADPVAAAFAVGQGLQIVVARQVSPLRSAVVSVTTVKAGEAYNIIPETARLAGTVRWFEPEVGDLLEASVRRIATAVAEGLGCRAEVDYQRRYPATVNDAAEARFVADVVGTMAPRLRLEDVEPSMGAEDFAFMLEKRPGAYVWLGAAREGDNPGLHNPRFDFNDAVLPDGAALMVEIARQRLGRR